MHHLGISRAHTTTPVLLLIDPAEVTVISIDTQTVLSTHTIDPNRGYWRNKKREPGRWPGSRS
jgi:hypothetical protein